MSSRSSIIATYNKTPGYAGYVPMISDCIGMTTGEAYKKCSLAFDY